MNIFTIAGAVLTGTSAIGLIVISAQWGIREVIDDYTGKGRRTAIAKMEAQRDAITGSQTNGLIQKYSAVDSHLREDTLHKLGTTSSQSSLKDVAKVRTTAVQSDDLSDMLKNQPNQLEVSAPKTLSTQDLLRADVDAMEFDVPIGVSERTSMLDENQTSVLVPEEDEFVGEGSGSFFEHLFEGTDVSQTSVLEPEDYSVERNELTENIDEATSSNFETSSSGYKFIATCIYNNIEL